MRRSPSFELSHRRAGLLLAALLITPHSARPQTPVESPTEVATRFLLSLEKKDFQTVRSLFTPAALVSSVTYAQNGAPLANQLSAEGWMKIASSELAGIEDFKVTSIQSLPKTGGRGPGI